jgi:prepilin-type N-terminal cleavage/methylation domain-containing protein
MCRPISSEASPGAGKTSWPCEPPEARFGAGGDRGFTLVEVMIATALSIILLGAAFNFFNDLEGLTESVTVMAEVNQNLRASTDLMARDIYQAGAQIPTGGIPLPNGNGASPVLRPGPGGYDFPTAADGGVLPVITPGYQQGGTMDGKTSDEITLAMIDENWTTVPALPISSITASQATGYSVNVTIPPPSCTVTANPVFDCTLGANGYNVQANDFLMFSTPSGTHALGLVTNVDTRNNVIYFSGDPLNLNQLCNPPNASCGGSIDSLQADPVNQPGVYPNGMALTKIDVVTYYLDNSNAANPYELMRVVGNHTANPVAYGINWVQITYDLSTGITNDDDQDGLVTASPNQISKVNLDLSGISQHKLRRSQHYFGNSLVTAVAVRNLQYVNQFP